MTQLIADVQKMDEERERLRQEAMNTLFPPSMYYDDMTRRVYDAAEDVLADPALVVRGNPFEAWMGSTPPGLDIAEFAMPPQYHALYHAP